jgi:DNA-binding response OmpR family regulator
LLVEDDAVLGGTLQRALEFARHAVDWVNSVRRASDLIDSAEYDLLILDLGLPDRDGVDLIRTLRRQRNPIPILVCSARDQINDRVSALDDGADDFVIKPFDLEELLARVRSTARRRHPAQSSTIDIGDISIDLAGCRVTRGGGLLPLTPREFQVLAALLERRGRVVSHHELEDKISNWSEERESNTIQVYVHHLRKKLGADIIRTMRGIGYIIDAE